MNIRYVTIKKFAEESGYSEQAIRDKQRDGVWPEGDVWLKARDGRILIDVEGYYKWVEAVKVGGEHPRQATKSRSPAAMSAAGSASTSSPLPLTTSG